MSAKESVAIIGMGISGSATLTAYYNVSQAGELPVSLTCIDSQHFFGRGIPFAPDSKHALVNTRSSDLTYNQDQPGDYVDWLQAKLGQAQVPEYTSRQRFGQY